MGVNDALPKTITATTDLELAALRAVIELGDIHWYGGFMDEVIHQLYSIDGVDDGTPLDLDTLSNILVRWNRSLR